MSGKARTPTALGAGQYAAVQPGSAASRRSVASRCRNVADRLAPPMAAAVTADWRRCCATPYPLACLATCRDFPRPMRSYQHATRWRSGAERPSSMPREEVLRASVRTSRRFVVRDPTVSVTSRAVETVTSRCINESRQRCHPEAKALGSRVTCSGRHQRRCPACSRYGACTLDGRESDHGHTHRDEAGA